MVLAVLDDLLFTSKIRAAAAATGQPIVFVRKREGILSAIREHAPSVVIFDLDRDSIDAVGTIREIRSSRDLPATRLVGFVSHVRADRIDAARLAGCDLVLARSAFVASLPAVLSGRAEGTPQV